MKMVVRGRMMKKLKTIITVFLVLLMTTSFATVVSGCVKTSNKTKNTRHEKEDKKDVDIAEGRLINTPLVQSDKLSEEALAGVWFDDNGAYCYFDFEKDIMYDYTSNTYEITEVKDYSVTLTPEIYGDKVLTETPIPKTFDMPMYLIDDQLYIGNNVLNRGTSSTGVACMNELLDEIVDENICIIEDYYCSFSVFNSDGTFKYDGYELKWECEEGTIKIIGDDYYYECLLRRDNDNYDLAIVCCEDNKSYPLQITKNYYDRKGNGVQLNGNYIAWIGDKDDIKSSTYRVTVSDSMLSDYKFKYESVVDNSLVFEEDCSLGDYNSIEFDNTTCTIFTENYGFIVADTLLSDGSWFKALFFDEDCVFAQLLLYREDILAGRCLNTIITDENVVYNSDGLKVTVKYGKTDNTKWENTSYKTTTYEYHYDGYYGSEKVEISPTIYIENVDGENYDIEFEIKRANLDENAEPALYFATDVDNLADETSSLDGNYFLNVEETDESIIFRFHDSRDGYYCLIDDNLLNYVPPKSDYKTVLNTNPEDSIWAKSENTGDIIDLVDLDYIKESIVDENGTAIFWVSTPEELASATYYVNNLYIEDDNIEIMYYIHLMNDIDLEGYEWTSIGCYNYDSNLGEGHYYTFQGVFFGNGYSIKNMSLVDSSTGFMHGCRLTTIVGLTLINPETYGDKYLMYDSCISEVFDCHVVLNELPNGSLVDFADSFNQSNVFFDCSYTRDVGSGHVLEYGFDEYNNEFYNGYDSWIRRYYQDDNGNYTYNASKEYSDFKDDPSNFLDCSYYYAEGKGNGEEHVGYIGFTGWLYDDEFMTNYGSIRYD